MGFLDVNTTATSENVSSAAQNSSDPSLAAPGARLSFFDTYFSAQRFIIETVLALLAAMMNLLILAAVRYARCHRNRSVYNTLFVNLAVANILSCVLSWLCNNMLFLFGKQLRRMFLETFNMCLLFVYLVAGVFVQSAFGIVSTLTMLGFTTVQYFAICDPLHHMSVIRIKRVRIFIACSWLISFVGGCIPFIVLIIVSKDLPCSEDLLTLIANVVTIGVDTCVSLVAAIYLVIIFLCLRIYYEIHRIRKRMIRFRHDQRAGEVQSDKKAFVTIVILLITLTVFIVPYTIIYVISLNTDNKGVNMHNKAIIYYMNLLPYLKFLSDPLIYGLRMREVKDGCHVMLKKCGFSKCVKDNDTSATRTGSSTTYSLQHGNSFTVL